MSVSTDFHTHYTISLKLQFIIFFHLIAFKIALYPSIDRALSPPETGSVTHHARMIFLKSFQSTDSRDLTRPTRTTEPTLQCVVLIGIPIFDATITVSALPTSIQNPLKRKGKKVLVYLLIKVYIYLRVWSHVINKVAPSLKLRGQTRQIMALWTGPQRGPFYVVSDVKNNYIFKKNFTKIDFNLPGL